MAVVCSGGARALCVTLGRKWWGKLLGVPKRNPFDTCAFIAVGDREVWA